MFTFLYLNRTDKKRKLHTFVSEFEISNRIAFSPEEDFRLDRPAILIVLADHTPIFVVRLIEPNYSS